MVVRGMNEVLSGELHPEVDLLKGTEAKWEDNDGSEGEKLEAGNVQIALQPGHKGTITLEDRKRVASRWRRRSRARG